MEKMMKKKTSAVSVDTEATGRDSAIDRKWDEDIQTNAKDLQNFHFQVSTQNMSASDHTTALANGECEFTDLDFKSVKRDLTRHMQRADQGDPVSTIYRFVRPSNKPRVATSQQCQEVWQTWQGSRARTSERKESKDAQSNTTFTMGFISPRPYRTKEVETVNDVLEAIATGLKHIGELQRKRLEGWDAIRRKSTKGSLFASGSQIAHSGAPSNVNPTSSFSTDGDHQSLPLRTTIAGEPSSATSRWRKANAESTHAVFSGQPWRRPDGTDGTVTGAADLADYPSSRAFRGDPWRRNWRSSQESASKAWGQHTTGNEGALMAAHQNPGSSFEDSRTSASPSAGAGTVTSKPPHIAGSPAKTRPGPSRDGNYTYMFIDSVARKDTQASEASDLENPMGGTRRGLGTEDLKIESKDGGATLDWWTREVSEGDG